MNKHSVRETIPMPGIQTARVINKKIIAQDVWEVVLTPEAAFSFQPGQYITILVPTSEGKKVGRSYSIASPVEQTDLTLAIKLVPNGLASTYVDTQLQTGDMVSFLGPLGKFLISPLNLDFLFVATGTGVAPFIPMISRILQQVPNRKVTLLLGFRHEADIFYAELFEMWQEQHPQFKYVCTLSKPAEDWPGAKGRVTEYLLQNSSLSHERQIYICGNGSMISDVAQIAQDQGIPKEQIFFEKYNNL